MPYSRKPVESCPHSTHPPNQPTPTNQKALAARHAVRVTFAGGDVHVGAYGCLQAHPKIRDRVVDPKFMLQAR
jgi:hypothetical protein